MGLYIKSELHSVNCFCLEHIKIYIKEWIILKTFEQLFSCWCQYLLETMTFTCSILRSRQVIQVFIWETASGMKTHIEVSNNSPLPLLVSGVRFAKNKQPSTAADEKAVFAAPFKSRFCLHASRWLNTQELLALSKQGWEESRVRLAHRVDASPKSHGCSCDGGDTSLRTYCR